MVDKDLARTKLTYIATNLAILQGKQSITEQEFLESVDHQYVVLHALQLAIQAALDLAAHLIADEGWDVPERSGEAFLILGQKKILEICCGRCASLMHFVLPSGDRLRETTSRTKNCFATTERRGIL